MHLKSLRPLSLGWWVIFILCCNTEHVETWSVLWNIQDNWASKENKRINIRLTLIRGRETWLWVSANVALCLLDKVILCQMLKLLCCPLVARKKWKIDNKGNQSKGEMIVANKLPIPLLSKSLHVYTAPVSQYKHSNGHCQQSCRVYSVFLYLTQICLVFPEGSQYFCEW